MNAQNVSYFLTDGAPTAGQEMGAADEAIWTDFLNRNDINSFAYGMGTGATQANLDPIAYNGLGAGNNTAGVVVADITQLPPILRDSILTPSGGDIVTGGLGEGSGLGADGGFLRSVTIDGTTYTYDPAGNGTITTSGTNRGTFDTSTNTMTISTTAGGKFVVDMDNGLYTYTPPVSTSTTFNESIGFSLQDQDGDTAGNTLTITVNPPGTAPASAIDTGLTLTLSTTTAAVATSGLHGEYYGYNETANIAGNNYQAGDTTVGNADRVADLNTIINLREGSTIVGSGRTASAAASDATWNATNLTYGASPTVTGNLGTNPNIASGGTAVTSGALYNFLGAGNAGSNAGTLQTTSSFGNTTDSMLRFAGSAYFAAGNYDFRVLADDGFSIRIDGVTVFEFNDIQSPTTRTSTPIAIGEGMHTIEILYWEQGGNAALQVAYRPTGSATFNSLSLDNLAMFQSTELPVLSDLQDIVESPTNGQYLIRTGQEVTGSGSNDTITGSAGRDRIHGGDGNDTISAGTGADWMEGGRGNDTLTGGAGSDTFRWQLSDRGITGQPAVDTITDFDVTSAKSGGDVLDLRDLLQGEAGVSNLQNYLDFNSANGSTVIRISTTGAFTNGTYSAAAADQEIVLQGVGNLRTSLGLATNATDTQVIQELINRGKLITD
ncbi:type I secretion C-terminal target domain-containing protein [Rhodoferax sp. TBRC 17198]|uniref:type I secretion C-terminal target domain-containing protein n=1 Tax=Rhodoferax potami TaxID=3068338 RepID=UPI0028BDF2AC|nr:type I secretion C-terminal target domain-containing protein [Rhodoferax sp. TBRC 17198]MDT7524180.1 type I secretion C-terminal target domain-containing protein [Rhodoferax sp. TBRC 17198]